MDGIFSDIRKAFTETSPKRCLCRKVRFTDDYRETRRKILENYSDPDLYTFASTQSGNIYVFREYYCQYLAGALNSDLKSKQETEIRDAEIFGAEGYIVLILPEKIILAGMEYNGKIPDALMNGMLIEFKNLESVKYSQFQKKMRDALSKADIAYVEIRQEMLVDNNVYFPVINAIYGQTNGKKKYDGKLVVTSVKGKNLTTYEIKNGTPVRVPLARLGDLPQPDCNIASEGESVKDEGCEFSEIRNGTPEKVPLSRQLKLPRVGTIAPDVASFNDGGL